MKELFERHYQAIVKRGRIDEKTSFGDFYMKLSEEQLELRQEITLSDNWKQEAIDLICATMNMLIHNNVDIKSELLKNIETQEKRANGKIHNN